MPERLTLEEVRHVARLARLALTDDELETYRAQLGAVLEHSEKLRELDVDDVEPLAHPHEVSNHLAVDETTEPLAIEALMQNAPASEQRFIAVPKVLIDRETGNGKA